MADSNKNNQETIFTRVFQALRKGRASDDTERKKNLITNVPDTLQNRNLSKQDQQQQFLDVQSHKVGKEFENRSKYAVADRLTAYLDHRQMNSSPLISIALDILADECVTHNDRGEILAIYSDNARVKTVLKDLFYNILNINYNLGFWIRELLQYGDMFLKLEIDQHVGIYDVKMLPVSEIQREEKPYGEQGGAIFRWDTNNLTFEEFQVAHFRILSDASRLPYGRCLRFDTYIDTEVGPKFIKDIEKGDKVWSFNTETKHKELSTVLDTICSGEKEIIKIRTKNNELEASAEHNVMIYENDQFIYKSVSELKLNDLLVVDNKDVVGDNFILFPIISIEILGEKQYVYDIHVDHQHHNFYANGIVVHNSILEPARKLWKQLQLAEDALLVYRLLRAADHRVYYLEIGNIDPGDVQQYVEKTIASIKKAPLVDQNGNINLKYNPMPVWKNTPVPLLDGRVLTIEEIAKEYESGKENYVYSVQDETHQIVPGKVVWCGKNYTAEKLIKVWLDDNTWVMTAPEHPFVLRDGSQKLAEELMEGDALMSFHKGKTLFRSAYKIYSVLKTEIIYQNEDVYCMTVVGINNQDDRHNFAIYSFEENGITYCKSGVFVKNSYEDDLFFVKRGDVGSRVEMLPGSCLTLDTKISLLDGRDLELNEIIKEYEEGKQLWSYSINPTTGKIVPGKITWAGVTRENTDVIKITLDNGETITCTPDHKFPTRFNGIKEAKDLITGESLWSFNKKFEPIIKFKSKSSSYEMVYNHSDNKWKFTHRIVANYFRNIGEHNEMINNEKYADEPKNTIHHKNLKRLVNCPENLYFMNNKDHYEYHHEHIAEWVVLAVEAWMKKYNNDEEFRNEVLERLIKGRTEYYENRTEDDEIKHNKSISKGLTAYITNLSESEKEDRRQNLISYITPESKAKAVQSYKNNPDRDNIITQAIAKGVVTKHKPENRKKYSDNTKKLWSNPEFAEKVMEPQRIKYDERMISILSDFIKQGFDRTKDILPIINNSEHEFYKLFYGGQNMDNKQLLKSKKITHNNLDKTVKQFGYNNWRDFKKKAELFNHKIVSIEWLEEKMDTGTITIDGYEKYHNYHNFALTVGIFTQNSNLSDIQDIEFLQNQLFAAIKVPKPYLNYADTIPGGSMLAQSDLRFSRTITHYQQFVIQELRTIANIHLHFLGMDDDINNYELTLTNPSTQQELLKLETMKARLEVFKEFFTGESTAPVSFTWAMQYILNFSEHEIKQILRQKKLERKMFAEIEGASEEYMETGIFKDLDDKFRKPDWDPNAMPAGEGGDMDAGGAGGGGGGMGGGGLAGPSLTGGGMDTGGGGDMGAESGGNSAAGTETNEPTTPESGQEEEEPLKEFFPDANKQKTSTLQKNNNKMNHRTKLLMEQIDKHIAKLDGIDTNQAEIQFDDTDTQTSTDDVYYDEQE